MSSETGNVDVTLTSFQNLCFEACKICKLKQIDTAQYQTTINNNNNRAELLYLNFTIILKLH
jgi:hypothetical protein